MAIAKRKGKHIAIAFNIKKERQLTEERQLVENRVDICLGLRFHSWNITKPVVFSKYVLILF